MKTINHILILFLTVSLFTACNENDINPIPEPDQNTVYDHSLIVASTNPEGNAGKLVFVNPVDGKEVFSTTPELDDIKKFAAGYMSKNVLLTSLTGTDITINSLFICDSKTGRPVTALTSENELNVMDITCSPASAMIAFTAKPAAGEEYYQLYTMNEDGSNRTHVSLPLEAVTGLDGQSYELLDISSPVFSPDGNTIAFNALVDNTYQVPNSIFYDGIVIMDKNKGKEMLFWKKGKNWGIEDISWTKDGKFLIFKINDQPSGFKRQIKAISIDDKSITDLSSSLEIDDIEVWDLATSPNSNKIVFNQHLSNGSDLFIAEYEINENSLSIKGSPVKLTNKETDGHNYYMPCWQTWDEKTGK
jgi:Tol biopolymer transport system component